MAEEVLSLQTMHDIAVEIRDATEQGVNEASKVGGLLVSIVDLLGDDTGLANFLDSLNRSNYLNNGVPEEGQTIVYNGGYWRFGAAGGGGGSFPDGSVLASLSQYGSSPGSLQNGYIIKWDSSSHSWRYAPDESGGQGTGDFTKTLFMASKWWGSSPTAIYNTQSELVGYRIKGNIIGSKENGDPDNIPLLNSIEFGNGIKLIASTDNGAYNLHIEGPTTQAEGQDPVTHVANFYATGGVSALGNSSGGGGGGGGDTLNSLLTAMNVNLTPTTGALMYDPNHSPNVSGWYFGSGGTISGLPEDLINKNAPLPSSAGYLYYDGSVYSWAPGTSGSINLATTSAIGGFLLKYSKRSLAVTIHSATDTAGQYYAVELDPNGVAFVNVPWQAGTTGGAVDSVSAVSGSHLSIPNSTGTVTIGFENGYSLLTSAQADAISNAVPNNTTWWGQSINNGKVDGTIKVSGESTGDEGGQIDLLGSGTDPNYLHDKVCLDNYSGDFRIFRDRSTTFIFSMSDGVFQSPNAIQIGAVKLICEGSNTIKVECANGNAGHLYATGGISALGLSSGSSPSIGNLTVTDKLTLQSTDNTKGLTFTDGTNTTPLYMNDGNLTVGGSGISFGSGVYANTSGFHATNLYATRVYLQTDPNDVYLYWHVEENNNRLRLVVGTTEYDISTSQVPTS